MGRRRAALIGLLAACLAACGPPAPALRTYSLASAAQRAPSSSPHPLPGVLTVMRFTADSVLNSRRVAWRSAPAALTVGNYTDHLWSASPPAALQTEAERCLRAARAAETVVPDTAPADADWILSGHITYFEQQLTGPPGAPGNAQARLGVDFVLTRVPGSRQPVWQDTVDIAVPLPDARPERVAEGIHRAFARLCPRLVKSLSAAGRSVAASAPAAPSPGPFQAVSK